MDNRLGLKLNDKRVEFVSSNVLYMVLNNHLDNDTLSSINRDFIGFIMLKENHCLYVKRSDKYFVILSLYVNDILLAGMTIE